MTCRCSCKMLLPICGAPLNNDNDQQTQEQKQAARMGSARYSLASFAMLVMVRPPCKVRAWAAPE